MDDNNKIIYQIKWKEMSVHAAYLEAVHILRNHRWGLNDHATDTVSSLVNYIICKLDYGRGSIRYVINPSRIISCQNPPSIEQSLPTHTQLTQQYCSVAIENRLRALCGEASPSPPLLHWPSPPSPLHRPTEKTWGVLERDKLGQINRARVSGSPVTTEGTTVDQVIVYTRGVEE